MTGRDQSHELIDQLDEESTRLPRFVGSFASGRSDISARAEEILREELGDDPSS